MDPGEGRWDAWTGRFLEPVVSPDDGKFHSQVILFQDGNSQICLSWWWILLLGLPADVRRWVVVNIGAWVRISTARGTSGSQRRKFRRIEKKYSQIRFNHGHCHCSIILKS